jgi:hypothetical protein
MATKSKVRFTIEADGLPRTLFSIYEKHDGTVFIKPKKDLISRIPFQHPDLINKPIFIASQKYSIHPSPSSPEKVNTIHSTTVLENGTKLEWRNLTKAIKSEAGFAFLNVRRCSSLAYPHFLSTNTTNEVASLGSYDPSLFTLYYAIIAGARDVPFNHDGKTDIGYIASNQLNILEYVLEHSRIILIWSFLAAPSHQTSMTFHNTTIPPTTPEAHKAMLGKSNIECVELFAKQCEIMEHEQRVFIMVEAGKSLTEISTAPIQKWHQDGSKDTGTTAKYVSGATERILTLPSLSRKAHTGG